MADSTPRPDSSQRPEAPPAGTAAEGTPRWVKVSGLVVLAFVLLLAVMLLGGHRPSAHGAHVALDGPRAAIVLTPGSPTP